MLNGFSWLMMWIIVGFLCTLRIIGFWGLLPSSGILKTREHNASETGFVSLLRWRVGHTYSVGSLTITGPLSKRHQHSRCLPPHLKTETDPVSETLCSLVSAYRTVDRVTKPNNSACYKPSGARGRVVDWGTMLQAGRSRVRFAMSLDFFQLT
jgi:hypothetical protein